MIITVGEAFAPKLNFTKLQQPRNCQNFCRYHPDYESCVKKKLVKTNQDGFFLNELCFFVSLSVSFYDSNCSNAHNKNFLCSKSFNFKS